MSDENNNSYSDEAAAQVYMAAREQAQDPSSGFTTNEETGDIKMNAGAVKFSVKNPPVPSSDDD